MKLRNVQNAEIFWLVWRKDGGEPTYQHGTFEGAQAEAERLARKCRGSRFIVLQAVAHAVVDEVQVVHYEDEIPF